MGFSVVRLIGMEKPGGPCSETGGVVAPPVIALNSTILLAVSLLLLELLKSFSGLEYGKYNFLQELLVINCKTQEKKRKE